MTTLKEFKQILDGHEILLPPETIEIFRDLIDLQADTILDQWLADKGRSKTGVE